MTELLKNFVAGKWQAGTGSGSLLKDPITGESLVRVDATDLDLAAAFGYARQNGAEALRASTYRERAAMLGAIGKVLQANRDAYYEIATANSGTTRNDSAVDIDGAIYTVGVFAKLGESLGDRRYLMDGEAQRLSKEPVFQSQHVLVPTRGVALFINAFNFPAWGLWEKAAPALLSGVPVIVKPATSTAWLTQRMVQDVIEAGILPSGALSIICGSSAGLLDQLSPFDVVSFTGSAETGALVRSHDAVTRRSVRANIEADSVNSAFLLPGESAGSESFDLLVREVVREMTVKSGQKCTAIRRVFVPASTYEDAAAAISAKLAKIIVGNPRNDTVRMGALVSRAQLEAVQGGLALLKEQAEVLHDGNGQKLVDVDPTVACCIAPTLLGVPNPEAAPRVHEMEVFGPVATLVPYCNFDHAVSMIRQGEGSLVASLYGSNASNMADAAIALADSHGRVHAIAPEVASVQTGHGNVMPQSIHGGPGRAGGGEELGGLRALNFYHRRSAIQASAEITGRF